MQIILILSFLILGTPGLEADVVDPLDLQPNWWRPFEVVNESYGDRADRQGLFLKEKLAELSGEDLVQGKQWVRRIELNLSALGKLGVMQMAKKPAKEALQKQYFVDEFLRLFRHRHEARVALQDASRERRQEKALLDRLDRQRQNLLLSYLAFGEANTEKLLLGLELMASRSAFAVSERKLELAKGEEEALVVGLRYLESELELAKKRLISPPLDKGAFEARRGELVRLLEAASDNVLWQESRVLGMGTSGDGGEEQAVIEAAVSYALLSVQLVRLQAEYELRVLLSPSEDSSLETINQRHEDWGDKLSDLELSLTSWVSATRREFDRASRDESENRRSRLDRVQRTLSQASELDLNLKEARLLISTAGERVFQEESPINVWVFRIWTLLSTAVKAAGSAMNSSLFQVGEVPVTLWGIVRALGIFALSFWFSWATQAALTRVSKRQVHIAQSTVYTLARLIHYVILTVGTLLALGSLGLNLTNLALVAGALSVGIGFGLQSIVNNFVSGLILLFDQSLKVGDFLELESGLRGRVTEIHVRSTTLRTNDGIEVIIPNSEMVGNRLINWTMTDVYRRMRIPFSVAYGSDLELVKKAALEAADLVPQTLKNQPRYKAPTIHFKEMGDSALSFQLVVWVDARASTRHASTVSAYLFALYDRLEANGIEIPYPQRDLHIRSGEELLKESLEPS